MNIEFCIRDRYAYCPACGEQNSDFSEIPPSRLIYTEKGGDRAEVTLHNGVLRDYKCRNCSHTWLMPESQP